MKCSIAKLAVFPALGAIINVAVAWFLSYQVGLGEPIEIDEETVLGEYRSIWITRAPDGFSIEPSGAFPTSTVSIGYRQIFLDAWPENEHEEEVEATTHEYEHAVFVWTGWPMYALYGHAFRANSATAPLVDMKLHGILDIPRARELGDSLWLPVIPLWPGFAINTIFYAAIVWMLCAVPGAVRRRVRIKRGQCASCGYSLCGTPQGEKCPECGILVTT